MSVEIPAQALARLEAASGDLHLADWQAHTSALADAVEGLSEFYLHVDATTGEHDPAPIYLDERRVVLGLIPLAVEPLVRLLQRQTAFLDRALAEGWTMPPTEETAWVQWHSRLGRYVASLERALAKPREPSEALWREVTAPLLQGLYPTDFDTIGIVNPLVPSKPDVSTVATTAFMVALQTQETSRVQMWLLSWREGVSLWAHQTRAALRTWFEGVVDAATVGAKEGARGVAKVLVVGVVAGGLVWMTWRALDSKR